MTALHSEEAFMNSTKNRLLIGAALLIALGLGFGVAQFVPHAEHEAQAEDGEERDEL